MRKMTQTLRCMKIILQSEFYIVLKRFFLVFHIPSLILIASKRKDDMPRVDSE